MVDKLLEAIRHDSLAKVRNLLEKDQIDLNELEIVCDEYDIDDPDEIPFLFWVIQSGASIELIEYLISFGLDIAKLNREGLGALDIAIKNKRMDIIELCGKYGISYTDTSRRSGMTPLMLSASFGDRTLVDFFLRHGADPRQTDRRGADAIEYARILGHTAISEYLSGVKRQECTTPTFEN